jgi:carbonic anhydrase
LFAGLLLAAAASTVHAGGEAMWSYEGATGPENWGNLAGSWGICKTGLYQSPINIIGAIETEMGKVKAAIKPTPLAFGLDGPTFAVPYEPGSWLTIHGMRYELQQFHFHHPSEHVLNGKHFPMEAHLVLKSEGSDHANTVLGIFIKAGAENAMLNQFWNVLPRSAKKSTSGVKVNAGELLPEDTDYYMYEGSMTTPGCIQSVRWFVLEEPVEASQAQIDAFIDDLTAGKTNNRPLQPTYGRAILKGN